MNPIVITRDEEICVKCGECIDACPHSGDGKMVKEAVITQEVGEVPNIITPENCIGCFACKDTCRSEAIQISGVKEIHSILTDISLLENIKRIY